MPIFEYKSRRPLFFSVYSVAKKFDAITLRRYPPMWYISTFLRRSRTSSVSELRISE